MIKRLRRSIAMQISVFLLIMVMVCAILVGVSSYVLYRADSIDANAERAMAIANSAASVLEPAAFDEMMSTGTKTAYWDEAKRALDEIKVRIDVLYLYALGAEYTDEMTYFAEGYSPDSDEDEIGFGDTEAIEIDGIPTYADEMFQTLDIGEAHVTKMYESGDFGKMVSGFAPIINNGKVVGVVGVDISLSDVMADVYGFGLRIIAIIVIFCIMACIVSLRYMKRKIGRPISALTAASNNMAHGDMDFNLGTYRRERTDEIGVLSRSFEAMADSTKHQVEILERLADGDLTMEIQSRGEKDTMSNALARTIARLNDMFQDVKNSSVQVSYAATQISTGAQTLASGSTQQAATLQEFSAAINNVLKQSETNADHATSAYEDTMKAGSLMATGMESMNELAASMKVINESSEKIASVIKVVDDIAFQTNILALNAAVEAARAGQHGKGFAVVADEVRNLASKSADAAKETSQMIEDSIQKVEQGVKIADRTQTALSSVSEIAQANAKAMEEISSASNQQNQVIAEITTGIGELSGVVQSNSATAEESAAAAEEMSSQTQILNNVVEQFQLNETKQLPRAERYPELTGRM